MPNLVGSLLRLPYTFAVPKFGGRNWTVVSALLLVIPTLLFAFFVQRPDTPFWVFMRDRRDRRRRWRQLRLARWPASTSSTRPAKKGTALGLNAAGGNLGVAVIQFFLPIIVGGAGAFGLVKASQSGLVLRARRLPVRRAGGRWPRLRVLLHGQPVGGVLQAARAARVVRYKHTWVMAFLYIGTFGSFIGYSAAMPLLIKINFFS